MMKNAYCAQWVVCFLVLCLLPLVVTAADADAPTKAILSPNTLVRATITSINDQPNYADVTLRVDTVYCGSTEIVGRTWVYRTSKIYASHGERIFEPPLTKDEVGIWSIIEAGDKLTTCNPMLAIENMKLLPVQFPVRKGIDTNYDQVEAFAETIARIAQLKPSDQVAELKKLATEKEDLAAMWAVYALADRGDTDSEAALGDLVMAKDTNTAAQAILYVIISTRRVERLIQLVSGDMTEMQALVLAHTVEYLVTWGDIPRTHIAILLRAGINNPKNPQQVQAIYKELLANHQKELY